MSKYSPNEGRPLRLRTSYSSLHQFECDILLFSHFTLLAWPHMKPRNFKWVTFCSKPECWSWLQTNWVTSWKSTIATSLFVNTMTSSSLNILNIYPATYNWCFGYLQFIISTANITRCNTNRVCPGLCFIICRWIIKLWKPSTISCYTVKDILTLSCLKYSYCKTVIVQ